jgi:hypothetical protein
MQSICKTEAPVFVLLVTAYPSSAKSQSRLMATKHAGSKNAGHGRESRVPGQQMAQAREGQLAWVLGACERVLRPLVKLALAFGVKYAQMEEVLRDVLLDEARRAWLETGTEPNISQLSVTTGLNRKAVTSRVREEEASLPQTEMSAEARTLTLWLQMFADDPVHRSLPITSDEESAPSFEAVARRASRGNVHHRVILDELVRLNMAIERDGLTQLVVASFVPASDLKGMLSFLGDNTRDHLLAAVSNTVGGKPPLLERSVFAAGISLEKCERIHQLARERWDDLHHEMTREMRRAYEAADKADSGRIRVGIYTYYEDAKAEKMAAQPAPRNPSESNK